MQWIRKRRGGSFEKKGLGGFSSLFCHHSGHAFDGGGELECYNRTLFYVEISLSILAVAAVAINIVQFKAYVRTVQKSAAEAFQGINKESMSKISLPVVVVGPKNDIVWYNTPFLNKVCAKRECIGESIVQFTSGLPVDQLLNRKGLMYPIRKNGLLYLE